MFGLKERVAAAIGLSLSAALMVALLWLWISTGATIRQLEKDKRDLNSSLQFVRDDLKQCQINGLNLQTALSDQSAKVAEAAAAGAARAAELARSLAAAKAEAASAKSRADRILAAKGTGDACKDADALILGELP